LERGTLPSSGGKGKPAKPCTIGRAVKEEKEELCQKKSLTKVKRGASISGDGQKGSKNVIKGYGLSPNYNEFGPGRVSVTGEREDESGRDFEEGDGALVRQIYGRGRPKGGTLDHMALFSKRRESQSRWMEVGGESGFTRRQMDDLSRKIMSRL